MINELTNMKRRSNVQPSKLKLFNNVIVAKPQIIAKEFNGREGNGGFYTT